MVCVKRLRTARKVLHLVLHRRVSHGSGATGSPRNKGSGNGVVGHLNGNSADEDPDRKTGSGGGKRRLTETKRNKKKRMYRWAQRFSGRLSRGSGWAGVLADQRNDRAGARDSLRLDGKYFADRRSPDHEPDGLRCRRAVHELACAAVAESQAPANDYFQAAVCAGYAGLREARDWFAWRHRSIFTTDAVWINGQKPHIEPYASRSQSEPLRAADSFTKCRTIVIL